MKFFGRIIIRKTNKYDIVTTLSIKTELMAILQILKVAIYLSCLMNMLKLFLLKVLIIKYNNK